MSIAKITDTGVNILLASTLQDAASVTSPLIGPAGTVNGTATFDGGLLPGTGGSASFANIDPNGVLRFAGQIVMTLTTKYIAEYDDSTSISGSQGVARAAAGYVLALEDALGTDHGRVYVSGAEAIVYRLHASDAQFETQITTAGKDKECELCLAWAGSKVWLEIDGETVYEATRANVNDDAFYKLFVGSGYSGADSSLDGVKITNLVLSRIPPQFATKYNAISLGVFGDSFVSTFPVTVNTPRFDGTLQAGINREIAKSNTYRIQRTTVDNYSGYTMCDTGASDLQPSFTAYVAKKPQIALIIAGQNDCTALLGDATTANSVLHATTGTEARYKELLALLANEQSNELIVLTNTGSLRQNTTVDTATNRATQIVVDDIINALPAWFDATYPARAGQCFVVDMRAAAGGDVEGNLNYQGALNVIGNVTTPGIASANDRHLSGLGGINVGKAIGGKIKQVMQL